MGIKTGPRWAEEDIYIDYPYEEVMFRWDHKREQRFRKFYGGNETSVAQDNRLYNDAIRFGEEITKEQYEIGKKRSEQP